VAPNLLERRFAVGTVNRVWVADLTYIFTHEGWLYLAVIVDLCSRLVVGWAMDRRMTTELAVKALRMAIWQRKPGSGLIHHSDRGSQYASGEYQALLGQHAILPSMSRQGDCYDNAVGESFFIMLPKN
jgi:putative transposase